jgi:hypothetical protein
VAEVEGGVRGGEGGWIRRRGGGKGEEGEKKRKIKENKEKRKRKKIGNDNLDILQPQSNR